MHIIESIKDNYLICDCCGDRIAPDEVALEKTDKDGRTIHICIDCENYDKDPEMEDLSESIEDDLARIEAGGLKLLETKTTMILDRQRQYTKQLKMLECLI
jgi:hypothetical protein